MSLSIRSQLANTNPYFAWAVEYILTYAQRARANFTITSVNRTAQRQWELWNTPGSFAVQPGCSQHQYGLAVDVSFARDDWQRWWQASARNFGLTTVRGDSVHAQLVPGAEFREWASSHGLCPDPSFQRIVASSGFQRPCHSGNIQRDADCQFWLNLADNATAFYS